MVKSKTFITKRMVHVDSLLLPFFSMEKSHITREVLGRLRARIAKKTKVVESYSKPIIVTRPAKVDCIFNSLVLKSMLSVILEKLKSIGDRQQK